MRFIHRSEDKWENKPHTKETYYKYLLRQKIYCIIFVVLALLMIFVFYGFNDNAEHSWKEGWDVLIAHLTGGTVSGQFTDLIFWENLFPRSVNGLFVGGVLGLAGAIMQIIMRNPLADPYTTGISSGAGFGATLWFTMGIAIIPGMTGDWALIFNAFILSLVPATAILLVMIFRKVSAGEMILVGIGIMYFFSSFSTVMMLWSDPSDYSSVYRWSLGHLNSVGWDNMIYLAGAAIAGLALSTLLTKKLAVLGFGDGPATSLGEDPFKIRMVSMFGFSLVVAVVVCFTGTIGFVGIVAPHIVRLTLGSNVKYMLPASFAVGGVMLLIADALAKIVVLPVGVITAVVGGPLFLYILIKQRKQEHFDM